jgi:hypothetical protein
MGPRNATRRPGAGVSAVTCLGKTVITKYSASVQVFNIDGERLPPRRSRLIPGAPRLAAPSWYRLAADRWVEVAR